jgi:hypothetical protein
VKNKIKAIIIGLAIGGLFVLGGYWAVNRYTKGLPIWAISEQSSTWGITLDPTICEGTDKASGSKWPCIPYEYQVRAVAYRGDVRFYDKQPSADILNELRTAYPAGSKIKVLYERKSPGSGFSRAENIRAK